MLPEIPNIPCIPQVYKSQLTFRELEVLTLCKKGLSCQEIGSKIFISAETVKSHRKKIIKKLGLKGKEEFRKFLLALLLEEYMHQNENTPKTTPKGDVLQ